MLPRLSKFGDVMCRPAEVYVHCCEGSLLFQLTAVPWAMICEFVFERGSGVKNYSGIYFLLCELSMEVVLDFKPEWIHTYFSKCSTPKYSG